MTAIILYWRILTTCFLFKDTATHGVEDCKCLESCNIASSGLDLSYVSLSALGINSFLGSGIYELRSKYHRALELKYVSICLILAVFSNYHIFCNFSFVYISNIWSYCTAFVIIEVEQYLQWWQTWMSGSPASRTYKFRAWLWFFSLIISPLYIYFSGSHPTEQTSETVVYSICQLD